MNLNQMKRLAYDLDGPLERERQADGDQRTLERVGVVNRATARRAGFRNPKKPRTMRVPK